jgi:hypothetical protein
MAGRYELRDLSCEGAVLIRKVTRRCLKAPARLPKHVVDFDIFLRYSP